MAHRSNPYYTTKLSKADVVASNMADVDSLKSQFESLSDEDLADQYRSLQKLLTGCQKVVEDRIQKIHNTFFGPNNYQEVAKSPGIIYTTGTNTWGGVTSPSTSGSDLFPPSDPYSHPRTGGG